MPQRMLSRRGETDLPVAIDYEVRTTRLGDVAVDVEIQGGSAVGSSCLTLLFADPHVQAVAVLDLRREALRGPVAGCGGDAVDSFQEHVAKQREADREGVLDITGRECLGHAGGSGIDGVLTGGHVEDQPSSSPGASWPFSAISFSEISRLSSILTGGLDPRVAATAVKPLQVIFKPVGDLVKRAEEVGNGRSDHDAQVVDRQLRTVRRGRIRP